MPVHSSRRTALTFALFVMGCGAYLEEVEPIEPKDPPLVSRPGRVDGEPSGGAVAPTTTRRQPRSLFEGWVKRDPSYPASGAPRPAVCGQLASWTGPGACSDASASGASSDCAAAQRYQDTRKACLRHYQGPHRCDLAARARALELPEAEQPLLGKGAYLLGNRLWQLGCGREAYDRAGVPIPYTEPLSDFTATMVDSALAPKAAPTITFGNGQREPALFVRVDDPPKGRPQWRRKVVAVRASEPGELFVAGIPPAGSEVAFRVELGWPGAGG